MYDNRLHTDAIVINSIPFVAITTTVYVQGSTVKEKIRYYSIDQFEYN